MDVVALIIVAIAVVAVLAYATLNERRRKHPRLTRLIVTPDNPSVISRSFPMQDLQKFDQADLASKHYTLSGEDQFGRAMPLAGPATIAGNDGQTTLDDNGLGFTTTLAVGGTSTFTLADAGVTAPVEIDTTAPVLTKIIVSEDVPATPAAS